MTLTHQIFIWKKALSSNLFHLQSLTGGPWGSQPLCLENLLEQITWRP